MVQRYVGGHRQAAGLGLGDQRRATSAGQLAEVRAHATLLHQQQITGQGHGLGGLRYARQAEEAGGRAFMGQATLGQVVILRVENHGQAEGGCVFQSAA